jgi:hypothetical protein
MSPDDSGDGVSQPGWWEASTSETTGDDGMRAETCDFSDEASLTVVSLGDDVESSPVSLVT